MFESFLKEPEEICCTHLKQTFLLQNLNRLRSFKLAAHINVKSVLVWSLFFFVTPFKLSFSRRRLLFANLPNLSPPSSPSLPSLPLVNPLRDVANGVANFQTPPVDSSRHGEESEQDEQHPGHVDAFGVLRWSPCSDLNTETHVKQTIWRLNSDVSTFTRTHTTSPAVEAAMTIKSRRHSRLLLLGYRRPIEDLETTQIRLSIICSLRANNRSMQEYGSTYTFLQWGHLANIRSENSVHCQRDRKPKVN